jgi:hypothetical protein
MISQVLADLKADSTLNGLINGRIYRSILPDYPTYPLVLFETEKEVQNTLSGESSLQHNIFDFMIMGVSYVECKDIFNALNNALVVSNNFRHTMLSSDDGQFNDEIEQYVLNAQSSIWKVNQDIPPTYNTIFTDATIDDISDELLADIGEAVTDGLQESLISQTLASIPGSGVTSGWIDYNDTTGDVPMLADTWTTIPNNGAGQFSNSTYPPAGVNQLLNTSTGSIDVSQLSLGDFILIRNDFTVAPTINNSSLEFRYTLGAGLGAYTLEQSLGRLDRGSGVPYRFSLRIDSIYMGDTNTRDNPIGLQVRCSSDATLNNAGLVIEVVKR